MLKFKEEFHSYESVVPDNIKWISATGLVSSLKEPFDAEVRASKSAKNRKSKWYGLPVDEIKEAWLSEGRRSQALGTWYHGQRESALLSCSTISVNGTSLPVIAPIFKDGFKYAPEQKLTEGIYPEHFVYLKSIGICGQSDLVEVVDGHVNIYDYKTNKELRKEGFKSWDGKVQKMLGPLKHLDDCHITHYTIQLSLYMYMILKHNPRLRPGKLIIQHVTFEEDHRDKYDNPVYKVDSRGDFIIKDVIPIEVPYLKGEIISVLNWLSQNRDKLKKK